MDFLSLTEQRKENVWALSLYYVLYTVIYTDFESKKLNTRQMGVLEHLVVLLSLRVKIRATGMGTITV